MRKKHTERYVLRGLDKFGLSLSIETLEDIKILEFELGDESRDVLIECKLTALNTLEGAN